MLVQSPGNWRAEDCEWDGSGKNKSIEGSSLLVRNQFSDNDIEGQLPSCCETVKAVRTDELVY